MFTGILSPSVTILTESGKIDYPAMEAHIEHLIRAGIDGILFFGSIGEFFAFSVEEKKAFVDFVVPLVKGRTSVLIGIGDTRIDDVIALGQHCQAKGVDGVVVIAPYYFSLSDDGARRFYGLIAEKVALPIMLYNFPARTNSDLGPALVAELAATYPNIVSIKDTVDNISHTRKVIAAVKAIRPDFSVLSGFDEYYLGNRISGGDGVLCGLTNVEPKLFVALHRAYEQQDFAAMQRAARRVAKLMALYDSTDLFVAGIKSAVKAKGLAMASQIREPAIQTQPEQFQLIEKIIREAGALQ